MEPVSATGLPHVARAATSAGIAWVLLNRHADYLRDLRQKPSVPVFCVSSDHLEIGRIQRQPVPALMPNGCSALYIQGPADTSATSQSRIGMPETIPRTVKWIAMKGHWTQEGTYSAVCSWLRLSTSDKLPIKAVIAQNDAMALDARKALPEELSTAAGDKVATLAFLGCNGLPSTGKKHVCNATMTSTVVVPPNTTSAMEILCKALQDKSQPRELPLISPASFPPIAERAAKPLENKTPLPSSGSRILSAADCDQAGAP
jgi:ABC-type sugar transport system substrate-binding protein